MGSAEDRASAKEEGSEVAVDSAEAGEWAEDSAAGAAAVD